MKLKWFNEKETDEMEKFCEEYQIIDIKVILDVFTKSSDGDSWITSEVSYLVMHEGRKT